MREPLPAAGIKAKSLGMKEAGLTVSGDCISTAAGIRRKGPHTVAVEKTSGRPHLGGVPQGL
jgi:hypothetical protein